MIRFDLLALPFLSLEIGEFLKDSKKKDSSDLSDFFLRK